MNEEPLVSVIIPTYKRPDKIIEAIKTVKKQTYSNFEIIIVDDNDPESDYRKKTRAKVESYNSDNFVYIEHKKNMGACAARNTGIDYAKGEYIAFLDDDDKWEKTKIEKQVNLMLSNKNLGLVFCNFEYISTSKKTEFEIKDNMFIEFLKRSGGISTSTFLVKSSILKKLSGFDINLPSNQDYDLLLRAAQITNLDFSSEILMFYDDYTEGITHNYDNKLLGREIIIDKYIDYYYEYGIEKYLYKQYETAAHFAVLNNQRNKAIKYINQSLEFNNLFKNKIKKLAMVFGGRKFYLFLFKLYSKFVQLGRDY